MSIIISVDGPAAAGKGTLARSLARALGFDYMDTGILYRKLAYFALLSSIEPSDFPSLEPLFERISEAVPDKQLRNESVGGAASVLAANPDVRAKLFDIQRSFATNPPGGCGAVLDGRDVGTAICPDANVKLWITASPEVRAERRYKENPVGSLDDVARSIRERDEREANRAASPMRPADDAFIIDSSEMSADEVLNTALNRVASILSSKKSFRF